MSGTVRMPAPGASRNGKRQLLAALSGKKTTPARTPSGSSLAPRRLAPSAATYSPQKKRKRPGDIDDYLETEDVPSRPQQRTRNTVSTPSSIANAARQAHAAQASLHQRSTPQNTRLPLEFQPRPPQKQSGNGTITPCKPKFRSTLYNQWGGGSLSRPWGAAAAPSNAPAGLVNLGNTCYLNAVLQSLFALPTFPGAISAAVAMAGDALPSDGVVHALSNCLTQRNASSAAGRSAFSPEQVKLALSRNKGAFRGSFQQDAHEFFCDLLEAVQAEVLAVESARLGRRQLRASETVDPNTRVFGFAVEHEITCTECNHVSHVTEQCTHLSLDLPPHRDKAPMVPPGLDSMLSSYFQEENVEKGCEKCGEECMKHTVRHRIKRLPQILALHVKRFQVTFQQITGTVTCTKVRDPVSISTALRLKQFCVEKPAMPLPPLNSQQQKENVELNNNNINNASNGIAQALNPSPAPEPAIRSHNFYSGSGNAGATAFDSIFSPPVATFSRKQNPKQKQQAAKGAARTSYWDKPSSTSGRNNWAERASNIISASGIEQRHRRSYEEEEEADLLAAIEASKQDQQNAAIGGGTPHGLFASFQERNENSFKEEDELDADLATALKRSLEEQQYQYNKGEESKDKLEEPAVIDLGEALTPTKNNTTAAVQAEKAVENITKFSPIAIFEDTAIAAADGDAQEVKAKTPGPSIPQIVEDDATIQNEDQDKNAGTAKETLPPPPELVPLPASLVSTSTITPAIASKQALATYQLTAVISHHGSSAESGHFTADTRNASTGQWYRFNDAQVVRIQGDAARNEMRERDCYMLYYAISSS